MGDIRLAGLLHSLVRVPDGVNTAPVGSTAQWIFSQRTSSCTRFVAAACDLEAGSAF